MRRHTVKPGHNTIFPLFPGRSQMNQTLPFTPGNLYVHPEQSAEDPLGSAVNLRMSGKGPRYGAEP